MPRKTLVALAALALFAPAAVSARAPIRPPVDEIQAFFECFGARAYPARPGQLVSGHPAALRVIREETGEQTVQYYAVPRTLRLFGLRPTALGQSELHWAVFAQSPEALMRAISRRWPGATRVAHPDFIDVQMGQRNLTITANRVLRGGDFVVRPGSRAQCSIEG
jgi:hypothetical protein